MMSWQSGVQFCHDNESKTLPVVTDSVVDEELMSVASQLPYHLGLCPFWLHLRTHNITASVAWRWIDNSAAGNYVDTAAAVCR